ncbi:MAG: prepilin-type N-terminal cleavage/methylation domain-containing protein [Sedimentisphaerales bacterium]|nr:prepilin-type N-terminal cleavage/methylation domain-containing protein [Sedimentisphaerales bacterium]
MTKLCRNSGFSLTEVLLAVGIIAIGMTFVAGVFPVGIYLTTVATERTVAAIVADEAFAKIRLCGVDPNRLSGTNALDDFNDVLPAGVNFDPDEFAYPSDPGISNSEKQYFWSALCRRVGAAPDRLVQVTVFISRKVNPNLEYYRPGSDGTINWLLPGVINRPVPVKIGVDSVPGRDNELSIDREDDEKCISDGYTIVDDETGRIYRVLERYASPGSVILLDRNWDDSSPGGPPDAVWVVPPPVTRGRYPCIAIYQKVIKF